MKFTYFSDKTGACSIVFIFCLPLWNQSNFTLRQVLTGEELLLAGNMMKKNLEAIKKVLTESTVNPMASLACECDKNHLNCLPCFQSCRGGLCDVYS